MDLKTTAVIPVTQRSFGTLLLSTAREPFPDSFLTAHRRAAGRPPWLHPRANRRFCSRLRRGAGTAERGPPSLKQLPGELGREERSAWDGDVSPAQPLSNRHVLPPGSHPASRQGEEPTAAPRWRHEAEAGVLGGQSTFPADHSYRNIPAQQLPAEPLREFTGFACAQSAPLLRLCRRPRAARELLRDVRETTVSGFGRDAAQGRGAGLELSAGARSTDHFCLLFGSIDTYILTRVL